MATKIKHSAWEIALLAGVISGAHTISLKGRDMRTMGMRPSLITSPERSRYGNDGHAPIVFRVHAISLKGRDMGMMGMRPSLITSPERAGYANDGHAPIVDDTSIHYQP